MISHRRYETTVACITKQKMELIVVPRTNVVVENEDDGMLHVFRIDSIDSKAGNLFLTISNASSPKSPHIFVKVTDLKMFGGLPILVVKKHYEIG